MLLLLLVAVLVSMGAGATADRDLVYVGYTRDGATIWLPPQPLPISAYVQDPWAEPPELDVPSRGPEEKIHPVVEGWLRNRAAIDSVRVIVSLEEDVRVLRLPEPILDEPDDSPANQAARTQAQELIRGVEVRRAPSHARHADHFVRRFGAQVRETF